MKGGSHLSISLQYPVDFWSSLGSLLDVYEFFDMTCMPTCFTLLRLYFTIHASHSFLLFMNLYRVLIYPDFSKPDWCLSYTDTLSLETGA